jgi:membrane-associated phospholipid phosphatase
MEWLKKRILLLSIFDLYVLPFSVFLVSISYLAYKGYTKDFILLILSGFGSAASVALKKIYKTPRPASFVVKHTKFGNQYSFPSSHTMLYFVFFSTWAYLIVTRGYFNPRLTYISVFSAFFINTFIGVSRVISGAHTKKDVAGGYFFGILFFGLLVLVDYLYLR